MITDDDIKKLAHLARLQVDESELAKLSEDLNSILGYVEQLQKINVEGIEPLSHIHGITNVLRDDAQGEHLELDEVQRNAPETLGRFFKVPLVVEQD